MAASHRPGIPDEPVSVWHDERVRPSSQRSRVPAGRSSVRSLPMLLVGLLICAPLLTGCLERSTTVGDRYSGYVIVATSPDNPRGEPTMDVPESMSSSMTVTEYREGPGGPSDGAPAPGPSASESATPGAGTGANQPVTRVGTRASFTNLTAGQFSQLGDIVAGAFGDSAMTMDLSAKRSGDVVRFRGSTDLSELTPNRDYVKLGVAFAGPITATNGEQTSDSSVAWTPEPGKPADFSADASYADPSTAAFGSWTWFTVLLCAIAVLIVVRLAWAKRDRSARPGRPVPTSEPDRQSAASSTRSTGAGDGPQPPRANAAGSSGPGQSDSPSS
ncbi:hypothetical protein GCM10009624_33210 [Gordonia sinesedis]